MRTMSKLSKAKRQLELELGALAEIRDMIHVQIHLGGMELKDSWRALEHRIAAALVGAERELEAIGEEVAEEALEALHKAYVSAVALRDGLTRHGHDEKRG